MAGVVDGEAALDRRLVGAHGELVGGLGGKGGGAEVGLPIGDDLIAHLDGGNR